MSIRSVSIVACAALIVSGGCGHQHFVGWPPAADQIEQINRSGGSERVAMGLVYADPAHPCGGGSCSVDGSRPVSDIAPFGIERVASADDKRLTVVTATGDVWHVESSQLAAVTTTHRATASGLLEGGAIGLGVSGLLFLVAYPLLLSGPGPDVDVAPNQSTKPAPFVTTALETMLTGMLIGAIIGAIAGHGTLVNEYFDFGGSDRSVGSQSSFSR